MPTTDETIARIDALWDQIGEGQDDDAGNLYLAMTELLGSLPFPVRTIVANDMEICPLHLGDAQSCADDDRFECQDLRYGNDRPWRLTQAASDIVRAFHQPLVAEFPGPRTAQEHSEAVALVNAIISDAQLDPIEDREVVFTEVARQLTLLNARLGELAGGLDPEAAMLLEDEYGARVNPDEIVARIEDTWSWLRDTTDRSVPDIVNDVGDLINLLLQLPSSVRIEEAARLDAELPDHVKPHLGPAGSFSEIVR